MDIRSFFGGGKFVSGESIKYNYMENTCNHPRRFLINKRVAEKERDLRKKKIDELITELAAIELDIKISLIASIIQSKSEKIIELNKQLDILFACEEIDSGVIHGNNNILVDNFLHYEYFKILELKENENGTKCIYIIENGNGTEYEIDMRKIINSYTQEQLQTIPGLQRRIDNIYIDFFNHTKIGTILAIGKNSKNLICHFYCVNHNLPLDFVFNQSIDMFA